MKHSLQITLILLLIFFLAQVTGLLITGRYINIDASRQLGKVTWQELPLNLERPQLEEATSYVYLFAIMLIGTILALFLIRLKAFRFWKIWFLFAITFCLTIAFGAFVSQTIAIIIAVPLAVWKTFRPNVYVHNFTELFIYGGIAALLVPVMNLFSITILLILVSLYDMYAVWQSKHMIKLAEFQSQQKIFAGLFIPYEKAGNKKTKVLTASNKSAAPKRFAKRSSTIPVPLQPQQSTARNAVLGGGDIGFPLMFSGVILKQLLFVHSFAVSLGYTLIISICATIVLGILLFKAQEGKYYPAMPFVSAGCFVGLGILKLVGIL